MVTEKTLPQIQKLVGLCSSPLCYTLPKAFEISKAIAREMWLLSSASLILLVVIDKISAVDLGDERPCYLSLSRGVGRSVTIFLDYKFKKFADDTKGADREYCYGDKDSLAFLFTGHTLDPIHGLGKLQAVLKQLCQD